MVLKIRDAVPEDFPVALQIAKAFHQESNFRDVPFLEQKMLALFDQAVNSPSYMFLVFEYQSEIIGGFIAYLDIFYFSDSISATDLAIFVKPERRGVVPIKRIVNMYKKWALENGAERITFAISSGINTNRTEILFSLLGFERTGAIFTHFPSASCSADDGVK